MELWVNELRLINDSCFQMALQITTYSYNQTLIWPSHTGQGGGLWGQQARWHAWTRTKKYIIAWIIDSAFLFKFSQCATLALNGNSESIFALHQCFNLCLFCIQPLILEMSSAVLNVFVAYYSEYLIVVWYVSFSGSMVLCQHGFENHFFRLPNKT